MSINQKTPVPAVVCDALVGAPKTNTLKYYLLEKGHAYNENTLHVFNSAPERDSKTIEVIFGADLGNQDEAECWDKYREELNDTGSLEFEGDPGLEWFTAWPASCPNNSGQTDAPKS